MATVKVIVVNGRIEINTDGFEDAAQAMAVSRMLTEQFQAAGIPITEDGGPEQHRPDGRHLHIHDHLSH